MAITSVSRGMYNLAVLDPARDTTARDRSKVESGKTEGIKKHCQFSFLWILNKTTQTRSLKLKKYDLEIHQAGYWKKVIC